MPKHRVYPKALWVACSLANAIESVNPRNETPDNIWFISQLQKKRAV